MKRKIAQKLMNIKRQVSAADRQAACKELDIHYTTVHNYLSGKVGNIDMGIRLLNFMRDRIAHKEELV